MIEAFRRLISNLRILGGINTSAPRLGRYTKIDKSCRIAFASNLIIDDYVWIGQRCMINAKGSVTIGNGTIISDEVVILSYLHRYEGATMIPYDDVDLLRPVKIHDYAWIGYRAMILGGVSVGRGAIVGAGAVVTRDVPDCAIVAGNPAQVVKYRDKSEFERLAHEGRSYMRHKLEVSNEKTLVVDQSRMR